MKVWWVLGGDYYYPLRDNFLSSFATRDEAYEFEKNHKDRYGDRLEWYEVINVIERL